MIAVPGFGALALPPEDDFVPPPELVEESPPDAPGDELDFLSLNCCANGSLLAKRLNDVSWPSATAAAAADASDGSEPEPAPGVWLPLLRVGAARLGVPAVVVVVEEDDDDEEELCTGAAGCSCFMTRGTWNASRPTKTTPSTVATIFCFFCFALRGSTVFLAITALPLPTRCWTASRWWS